MLVETQDKPHPHHSVVYFVNGEREESATRQLTVRSILEKAGFTPATDYKLTSANPPEDFGDGYDCVVTIHPNQQFHALHSDFVEGTMIVDDFEQHVRGVGLPVDHLVVGGQAYVHLKNVRISAGTHAGSVCDVAILRTTEVPWAPQAAVHVKPHLVRMGERCSQASLVGPEWQYLSRRFERTPSPKQFYAHILTVLGEL